jgi:putative transposase
VVDPVQPEHVLGNVDAEWLDSHKALLLLQALSLLDRRAVHPISWRNEYGGLKSDGVKRLKDLETENARLRKATSDLTLDKLILQEAARGNY